MGTRPVSVVINTYNRAASLGLALRSLEQLDYSNFEVVVVNGPSSDDTETVIAEFGEHIKVGRTPNRNLSESRNIGIALAAGEIVAFIDDDAYADPAWLDRLVAGYDDGEIAGVGGPLYDHTGARLQVGYSVVDRFGRASTDLTFDPTPYFNHPYALHFAHIRGANSSFRRDLLVDIGGFDEEFEYFLDESDVCCRLVDSGFVIRELADGFVYHKVLPSDVRIANRAVKDRHAVLKNTVYFAMKHGLPIYSFNTVCERITSAIEEHTADYRRLVASGDLSDADLAAFESDIPNAVDEGFRAFQRGQPRHRDREFFSAPPAFHSFGVRRPQGRRLHVCFFSQEWAPAQLNGIARFVSTLAIGLASDGHIVRVLTWGTDHDRVDLEDGVWVHRVAVASQDPPAGMSVPARIWDYSASLLNELRRIHSLRAVDVVQIPNWDSEGIAVLLDGAFTTMLFLHTPLKTVRSVDPMMEAPAAELDMLEGLERFAYDHAHGLLACGPRIVDEIEHRYGIRLHRERIGFVPHGLPDVPISLVPRRASAPLDVLFVGRLEARKGIDTLLATVPGLLRAFPDMGFTLVGRDDIPAENGRTHRENFEASVAGTSLRDRVTFTGPVSDDALVAYYGGCDIFVSPSRYKSFGLILLEAMRAAKPVIACRVGGMMDVVEDGGNGFLVEPGDVAGLHAAIAKLAASPVLRSTFGARSRELFESRYTVEQMVTGVEREYQRLISRLAARDDTVAPEPWVSQPSSSRNM